MLVTKCKYLLFEAGKTANEGERTVVVSECLWFWGKNKALSNITVFIETFSCIQYFRIMESVFYSDCYRDLILGRNCIFTRKYIEIRKSFIEYRSSPRVPTKAFACICVHIFCIIYESGVLAHGRGGGRVVYGPKSNDQAAKNDVYV